MCLTLVPSQQESAAEVELVMCLIMAGSVFSGEAEVHRVCSDSERQEDV